MQALVQRIKQINPLVLNITNDVTMDFIANGLLSLGASPVMSKSEEEMEELIRLAKAVVINLGTLNPAFTALCDKACSIANQWHVPIILDPVGAGATQLRTTTSLHLLHMHRIAIVRGNASEIMALAGHQGNTKGVDSSNTSEQAITAASFLSQQFSTTVVISGEIDFVVHDDSCHRCTRGSALMPTITGTGCLLSAVVAAFHAIEQDAKTAAHAAVTFYGICGEIAAQQAKGPGSFRTHFLDALHQLPTDTAHEKN